MAVSKPCIFVSLEPRDDNSFGVHFKKFHHSGPNRIVIVTTSYMIQNNEYSQIKKPDALIRTTADKVG